MFPDNPGIWLTKEAHDCPRDSDPAKGNLSNGVKGLAILLKGKYSFHFVHNTAARGLLVFELFFLKCSHAV